MCIIKIENLCKRTTSKQDTKIILNNLSLYINKGDFVAITGTSGAGKTTLLKILALIESFDCGDYWLNHKKISFRKDAINANIRKVNFGYIPQNLGLIESISVYENILIPLYIQRRNVIAIKQKIDTLSRILNIHHLLAENTDHLSLGEKQRVAILRACIKQPSILFADEPTASLDPENKKIIMKLFQELNHKGTTIIMNSHDHEIIECTNTRYLIKNGIIKKL